VFKKAYKFFQVYVVGRYCIDLVTFMLILESLLVLQYFFIYKFNQREKEVVLLVLLQSPRLLDLVVIHDGLSGEAGGLQQDQRHQLIFSKILHCCMNLLDVDDIPLKKHT
jgi:hypothetical protein